MAAPPSAPRIVLALDIGTSYSGYAFAAVADERIFQARSPRSQRPDSHPSQVYEWPMQVEGGGMPYCKTRSDIIIDAAANRTAASWGWPAYQEHAVASSPAGAEYAARYKLLLMSDSAKERARGARLITAYVKAISAHALEGVRKQVGEHILPSDIQWLLTGAAERIALRRLAMTLTRPSASARHLGRAGEAGDARRVQRGQPGVGAPAEAGA